MSIVWFVFRGNTRIDYRLAVLGAMLPDLIDKPLGRIIFKDRYASGRLWGHTLLLNVAFFCILFFMRGRLKRKAVLLPTGSLLHLAEDAMWNVPRIFWWPLFGSTFPRSKLQGGLLSYLDPTRHPGAFVQEFIGLALIVWLLAAHEMLSKEGVMALIRTGRLELPARDP